jgi:hypothetical protein
MNPEELKELESKALAPFAKADRLLLKAEIRMLYMGRAHPGGKSEIRIRFEEFESNLALTWENAFKEYGVNNVYALPIPVYRQICEDFIHKPGVELISWLSSEAAKLKCEAHENPYVMAGAALGMAYNLGGV